MLDPITFVFSLVVLVMSVIAHEVAHGYAAERLGDPTARLAGRLTLNPVSHFDMMGSFIVPIASYFLGGFVFGWAKPVPYNPYNMRSQKWGGAIVAVAGPLTNIGLALIFGLLVRFSPVLGLPTEILPIVQTIVFLNLTLALFNALPIPPLDGSKILFALLPYRLLYIQEFLERFSIVVMILLVFFFWQLLLPIVYFFYTLITGLGY